MGRGVSRRTGLFGRDQELARLTALLDLAIGGEPGGVLVSGEAGIGKTRLVVEVSTSASARGVRVVRGEALEDERSPYSLWWGARPRLLPAGSRQADELTDEDVRWSLLDEVRSALAEGGPTLLVLEDLHWADEPSIWVMDRLVGSLGAAPVLVLATARTTGDLPLNLVKLARADHLALPGLDLDAARLFVNDLVPDGSVEVADLWKATAGNPLLIRERAVMRGRFPSARPPQGVLAVLRAALEPLAPDAARVVAALALTESNPAPAAVLAVALGVDPRAIGDAIERAVQLDVLERGDGSVHFRHDLLARAAAAQLDDGEQRDLHLSIGAAWQVQPVTLVQRIGVARHLMAALPLGDAAAALESALDAMGAARAVDRPGVVADVGLGARRAMAAGATGSPELAVQLLIELGDALRELGDLVGAAGACDQAADLADDSVPATLVARAEVGASLQSNVFIPDPKRLARLAAAEARIPEGDNPTRASVLARLAVLGTAFPDGLEGAHRHGDEAVRMARRIGDPELLVDALLARHFVPLGPEGLAARARAAEEIVVVGTRLRRPDIAMRGLEWRAVERLDLGDGTGADEALAQMELLAAVMPSPHWRYTAMVRRAGLWTLAGDRDAALDVVARAADIGSAVAHEYEAAGLELAGRVSVLTLWRTKDQRAEEILERLAGAMGGVPSPFIETQLAWAAAALGDPTRAAVVVERYAAHLDALLGTVAGLVTASVVAALAADLGIGRHAATMRSALGPYEHRIGVGNGGAIQPPVAAAVGRLALLDGDIAGAVDSLRTALALVERAGSPPLMRICRLFLADALDAAGLDAEAGGQRTEAHRLAAVLGIAAEPAPPPEGGPGGALASLTREGPTWRFASPLGHGVVAHTKGLDHLARLLALPGVPLDVTDLAPVPGGPARGADLGAMLDARAKREYRQRVADLRAEIDEAEADNDAGRAELAHLELDALVAELRRAVGLGGRDRPSGSGSERARVNVTRSLRRAIDAIAGPAPMLAAHLDRSVRTGRDCAYDPEPAAALRWEVRR